MKGFLVFCTIFLGLTIFLQYCDSKQDPYEIGSHWNYSIICNDGFKYKRIDRGFVPCLNSDGTPLKCDQKRY
jgi:hypothetical protein